MCSLNIRVAFRKLFPVQSIYRFRIDTVETFANVYDQNNGFNLMNRKSQKNYIICDIRDMK